MTVILHPTTFVASSSIWMFPSVKNRARFFISGVRTGAMMVMNPTGLIIPVEWIRSMESESTIETHPLLLATAGEDERMNWIGFYSALDVGAKKDWRSSCSKTVGLWTEKVDVF